MTGKDLLRPVQLFEQHAARQQMRPSHLSKREHGIGAGNDGAPETVCATDREGHGAGAGVAPVSQALGEFDATPACAALIERDQPGPARQCGEDQLGFARFQLGRRQRTLFLDLDDRRRWYDPPGIERLKLVERPAALPPDGEDMETDRRAAYCSTAVAGSVPGSMSGRSAPHIFSRS